MARYKRVSSEQHGESSRFEDLHPQEQRVLLEWIQKHFQASESQALEHQSVTAYGLKHRFERSEFGFHVFSREFAGAMERAGFQSEETQWGDWRFTVASNDLRSAVESSRGLEAVEHGTNNPGLHV